MKFLAHSVVVLGGLLAATLVTLILSAMDVGSEFQVVPVSPLGTVQAFAQFQ